MKIFMWVQNKLARSNHHHKTPASFNIPPPPTHDDPKVQCGGDFGEWQRRLLTIGTLGSNGDCSRQAETEIQQQNATSSTILDFDMDEATESEFLKDVEGSKAMSMSTRWNELRFETKVTSSIRKMAPALLLKQMFSCGGGFPPVSSSRDPMPESSVDKMLRAILRKKIHPRTSAQALQSRRYLEHRQYPPRFSSSNRKEHNDDDPNEAPNIKWDRTDSEYIVLEI